MSADVRIPQIADAVVLDGVKYRIRGFDPLTEMAELARNGPSWRHAQIEAWVRPWALVWDRVARLWRSRP